MSFFGSLFGVCCGPEVFKKLREHSGWRVFRHLLLLTILCSIVIGIGEYYMLRYRWRYVEREFGNVFGTNLKMGDYGAKPEKDPDVSRRIELPYNGLLIYVSGKPENYPDETLKDRNFILLWSSGSFVFAMRNHTNQWFFQQHLPEGSVDIVPSLLDFEQMREKLDGAINLPPSKNWYWRDGFEYISVRQLFHYLRFWLSMIYAFVYFFKSLFLALVCTGFFSIVFKFAGSMRGMSVTAFELWKIGIYAAFPVLIVMSAFPALELPLLRHYDTLFMIGWIIYQVIVLRYLAKHQPEKDMHSESGEK